MFDLNPQTVLPKLGGIGAAALAMALALSLSAPALADTRIDTDAQTSLTVSYLTEEGEGIPDIAFQLYRVADVSDTLEMTLSGDFSEAPVSLDDLDSSSDWSSLALTLSGYAAAEGLEAMEETTDKKRIAEFDDLTVGLYLLTGDSTISGDLLYTPAPAMILLPTLDDADNTWDYDPTTVVKYETGEIQEYTSLTVRKAWEDGDNSGHPNSVVIQLLQDKTVLDTVVLSEENGWKYTWTDLPVIKDLEAGTAYSYKINEADVPENYRTSVTQSNYTYKVTNTYIMAGAPKGFESNDTGTSDTLPQTGQLNWPIPYLAASGLFFIWLGLYLRGKDKKDKEGRDNG